jgi:hypothetical protein
VIRKVIGSPSTRLSGVNIIKSMLPSGELDGTLEEERLIRRQAAPSPIEFGDLTATALVRRQGGNLGCDKDWPARALAGHRKACPMRRTAA